VVGIRVNIHHLLRIHGPRNSSRCFLRHDAYRGGLLGTGSVLWPDDPVFPQHTSATPILQDSGNVYDTHHYPFLFLRSLNVEAFDEAGECWLEVIELNIGE
jgi:hypothetical protein